MPDTETIRIAPDTIALQVECGFALGFYRAVNQAMEVVRQHADPETSIKLRFALLDLHPETERK